jgi:protein-S-isoprenylcysteine O-methyltransferase Ste14
MSDGAAHDVNVNKPYREEIKIDKSIDRALALLFLGLVSISLYSLLKADSTMLRIEVAGSIPLNLMAAISFITREPAREMTCRGEIIIPTVAMILPFLALNSPMVIEARYSTELGLVIAILGGTLSVISFLYLRRSFAIMPAVRTVISGGPYMTIRHPLYLGEFIYILGMVLLGFSLISLALIMASAIFLVYRIQIEECKLRKYPEYVSYARQVKFRLIPYVY